MDCAILQARALLASIDLSNVVGRRDRALLAIPRTTRLYDRRDRKITRNVVEPISV